MHEHVDNLRELEEVRSLPPRGRALRGFAAIAVTGAVAALFVAARDTPSSSPIGVSAARDDAFSVPHVTTTIGAIADSDEADHVGAATTTTELRLPERQPAAATPKPQRPVTPESLPSTTTSVASDPPFAVSPLEPGTEESGHLGYGAKRTVERGRTKLVWEIYPRDIYDSETVQTTAEISEPGVVVDVVIEFGDGTSHVLTSPYYTCATDRPNPISYQGPWHSYPAPGDYTLTVTVTTRACEEGNPSGDEGSEHVLTASLVLHVHPGKRP